MAPSKAAATSAPFSKDERVLCFHHEMLYEAKVLDSRPTEDRTSFQYKIHYKGWKNTWDDWVPQDRVRKFTEENKELAAQLHNQMKALQKQPKAGGKKGQGGRATGSDFSSARGSEERTASVAAQTGRGGPRRARDYEIENTSKKIARKRQRVINSSMSQTSREPSVKIENGSDDESGILHIDSKQVSSGANSDVDISRRPKTRRQRAPYEPSAFKPPRKRSRRTVVANPPWAIPGSKEWDVLRVLDSDEFLAPDHLLDLPAPNHKYLDASGQLKDRDKYQDLDVNSFYEKAKSKEEPKIHPKLQAHITRGTDTPLLRLYYRDMPENRVLPFAGIIRDKPDPRDLADELEFRCGPGREMSGGSSFQDPEVRDSFEMSESDDSSELSELESPDENMFPNLIPRKILPGIKEMEILTRPFPFQEDSFLARPSVKLVIPDHIKAILVDDWENVTKTQQLVPLPAKHSVNSILKDYAESERPKRQVGSAQADILEEVVAGLTLYFDKCLGRILLYRFERIQYLELRQQVEAGDGELAGKSIGDIYGAEHLCRLLVSLPELIAQTNMDLQSVNRLREELSKITNFLVRNAGKYFSIEYETPSQEYVEKARGV